MPLIYKYLLRRFFQIFALSNLTFIAILLLMRLQLIARFATFSNQPLAVALFTLYQIPYILPLAFPISSLISAFILMQSLSQTLELTALRASGLSLKKIMSPLIITALFLALIGGLITSEITPRTRFLSQDLVYKITTSNPLLLVQKDKLMKVKHSFCDMTAYDAGHKVGDLTFIFPGRKSGRLSLLNVKKLKLKEDQLVGTNLAFLTTLEGKERDQIILENQQKMVTSSPSLAQMMIGKSWTLDAEFLPYKWMKLHFLKDPEKPIKALRRFRIECARRLSLALCSFTLTILGGIYGMQIGRKAKKKGLLYAAIIAALLLFAFAAGQSFHQNAMHAALCYLIPHPIAWGFGLHYFRRRGRGLE